MKRAEYSDGPVRRPWIFGVPLLWLFAGSSAQAAAALIAVAANFAEPLEALVAAFEDRYPHQLDIAMGSTGKLYAQITQAAPFDVLLAADDQRPALLEAAGTGIPNSRFTYALGRLCLWSSDPARITSGGPTALSATFRRLAMANPDLAPYGVAALETLDHLGLRARLEGRIVMGENVAQAFAMVTTGNAELGFVACSLTQSSRNRSVGSHWQVPASMHTPIRQQAVLLQHGAVNPAATAFLEFLRSAAAQAIIVSYGYDIE